MTSVSTLIEATASELHLEVKVDPFHGSRGIELQKRVGDTVVCVGYISGAEKTEIYRMTRSRKDEFVRNRLWFFWGWLFKSQQKNNRYEVLQSLRASEFDERLFVELARKELTSST